MLQEVLSHVKNKKLNKYIEINQVIKRKGTRVMRQDEKLQYWIEQGSVHMSQLFFRHYKKLSITDTEAMFILQMVAFQTAGHSFPTPEDFSKRMHLSENDVALILQKLMQFGFLKIVQSQDENGVYHEHFSLAPLWNRLTEAELMIADSEEEQEQKLDEGELFKLFEQEFGRFLSPMEVESISMWLDDDAHTPEIIRAALREAVIAEKVSLRYIDRILFEWKKKNVKTLADVEQHAQKFRTATIRNQQQEGTVKVKRVPFYNWLEERE